ncbi:MAG: SpoIID/LytB domain-containing protein [Phycisphaeraceae bacterium]
MRSPAFSLLSSLTISRALLLAACALPASTALAVPSALNTIFVQGFGSIPTESQYVPYVTYFENGAASTEALKAQAVAARTYAYYKMETSGGIANGTNDQVYFIPNRGLPQQRHYDAVAATEGEILTFSDTLIAAFYVAGSIPTAGTIVPGSIAQATAASSDPTDTEKWVTYTWENGDLGNNNIGTPLGFQGNPNNPFYRNRGAKSQNGANYMGNQGYSYIDILKYYYGADIQLEQVDQGATPIFNRRSLTDFEGDVGYFGNDPLVHDVTNSDLGPGTTFGFTSDAQQGASAQQITIDLDEAADSENDGFIYRHAAGATLATGFAGQTAGNVLLDAFGSIGFWLKTTTPGLQVALHLDENEQNTESSLIKNVVADGQWRKYEWFLDNPDQWFSRSTGRGGTGSGAVEDRFSLDSIVITGDSDAVVLLDDIFYDPQAVPALPGDFNNTGTLTQVDINLLVANLGDPDYDVDGDFDADFDDIRVWIEDLYGSFFGDATLDGTVDLIDLSILASRFGSSGVWTEGEFNGDGVVDLIDLSLLASNFGSSALVPEPASAGLLSLSILSMIRRR